MNSTRISSLSDLNVFPNPTKEYFNFSVQAQKSTTLHWTLTHTTTGTVVLFGQTKTDSDGFANQQILLPTQLRGAYVFRVFSGNEQLGSQLIIQ